MNSAMNNETIEYENLRKLNEQLHLKYKENFSEFLETGWCILGKQVANFEEKFAKYCGVNHCIGVANGLDALVLAIDSFDFPQGSEIIVPSNTYIATILSIVRNGHKPILVEPDIRTYNIDPTKIEASITQKTKAIVVVHLYGKCCDMDSILELAKKYHLEIIEDVAQAHGAKYKNKMAGSFGIGCFSFYPTKNLGALADAGAITVNNLDSYAKFKALRNYGSFEKYYNEYVGYNSRLDEIQAGFLNIKLEILEEINNHKRNLASIYDKELKLDYIKPIIDIDYHDVYHIYNIRHERRDELKDYLLKNNIKTEIHYPLAPNKQKAMQGIIEGEFPISELIHKTTLSLPISYCHTENDIYRVIEALNKF